MTVEMPSTADIETLRTGRRRSGWPEDLRVLVARYPREQSGRPRQSPARWRGSVLLASATCSANWPLMIAAIEAQHRSGDLSPGLDSSAPSWRRGCNSCFGRLGVHHQIEDLHYFPIFRAEEQLARGFDVLEGDHHAIHADMAATAETANALLRALSANLGDKDALKRCGDDYAAASGGLIKGLVRHLDDEEDLIVPLILACGEDALGVAHHG